MNLQELKNTAKKILSNKRYQHICSVETTAVNLYDKYNNKLDVKFDFTEEDVRVAAILHDITKEKSVEQQQEILNKSNEDFSFLVSANKNIWHAFTGAIIAKEEYQIDNKKIIEAIKYHTTGAPNIGSLAKIIYIADYIEPLRLPKQVEIGKKNADKSINQLCLIIAINNMNYLKSLKVESNETLSSRFISYLEKEVKKDN